nr:hypothetical protein [Oscillochloris trichoides]
MKLNPEQIRWLFLGAFFFLGMIGVGIRYNWPMEYLMGLLCGLPIGAGWALTAYRSSQSTPRNHENVQKNKVVLVAPLIGLLLVGLVRIWGGERALLVIGGASASMMLLESLRIVFFGDFFQYKLQSRHEKPESKFSAYWRQDSNAQANQKWQQEAAEKEWRQSQDRLSREEALWRDRQRRNRR